MIRPRERCPTRWPSALLLVLAVGLLGVSPAQAKRKRGKPAAPEAAAGECKKGKKKCGDKCIPQKKVCKEEVAADGAAAGPKEDPKLASASSEAVSQALASQPGKAMLQLARVLNQSGDLDVSDAQRQTFRQALRGSKPPLPICVISHVQLVRDCDPVIGSNVTLPCYLAVDEMAEVCKLLGQEMPQMK